MSAPSSTGPRAAFSLIELLVVVAIIGVLAALLLPGLRIVRESAHSLRCLSQLRQIGVAGAVYSEDNQGYVVPHYVQWTASDGTTDGVRWYDLLVDYLDRTSTGKRSTDPRSIFICPTPPSPATVSGNRFGYGINSQPDADGSTVIYPGAATIINTYVLRSRASHDARRAFVGDCRDTALSTRYDNNPPLPPNLYRITDPRHRRQGPPEANLGRWNAVFFDGHVETLTVQTHSGTEPGSLSNLFYSFTRPQQR